MNPESRKPDREDALALIAGIERASRRSRPFFLFGLLAVILGFASVSVYLYQDREEERAQKTVLERQVAELGGTLKQARDLLPELDDSSDARDQLRRLLRRASDTARELPAAVAAAESGTPGAAPTRVAHAPPRPTPAPVPVPPAPGPQGQPSPPPRSPPVPANYVIRISEPGQRNHATDFQRSIHSARVSPVPIAGDNSLRCFTKRDCVRVEAVTRSVNLRLAVPQLVARRDIGGGGNLPPGTYEIRFAPGPIRSSHYDE